MWPAQRAKLKVNQAMEAALDESVPQEPHIGPGRALGAAVTWRMDSPLACQPRDRFSTFEQAEEGTAR